MTAHIFRPAPNAMPRRPLQPADYLKKILTARVYDVAIESPLEAAPGLTARTGNPVLLKREDMQPVFSFKKAKAPTRQDSLKLMSVEESQTTAFLTTAPSERLQALPAR